MHRALPVARRVAAPRTSVVRVAGQRVFRRFASTSEVSAPKKKSFTRRLVVYSTVLGVAFYASSPVVAFNNDRYHAFFTESIPFGATILDYAEDQGWDRKLQSSLVKEAIVYVKQAQELVKSYARGSIPEAEKESAADARATTLEKLRESKEKIKEVSSETLHSAKERVSGVVDTLKTKTEKIAADTKAAVTSTQASVDAAVSAVEESKRTTMHYSEGVEELIRRAEAALAGKPIDALPEATTTPSQPAGAPPDIAPSTDAAPTEVTVEEKEDPNVYKAPLPIGFEPPPGFTRPKPPKAAQSPPPKDAKVTAQPLPQVAKSVSELAASEPVIAHLATTIDTLAAFVAEDPKSSAEARGVLDAAVKDLTEFSDSIQRIRQEEQAKLDAALDEQARSYTLKLLETEMHAQDQMDERELEFKAFFEEARASLIQEYRGKLENELKAQSEIINERLKQEVIAQGIEMQRRWIREIKVRVEQERGGRLAHLDELAAQLKQLERLTLDNASYLDESIQLHALWAALRALDAAALDTPTRRPFRDELRVLRHVNAAREDTLVSAVLDALEASDVPDVGVEPLPDLAAWLESSVAPQVARVALVPEQDAGVLAHVASYVLSVFRFRQRGLVEGDDVLSVLARAEHYMGEGDLDSAARELNQLRGTAKLLLADWLDAARRRLEVLQAVDVVQSQATLGTLLVA